MTVPSQAQARLLALLADRDDVRAVRWERWASLVVEGGSRSVAPLEEMRGATARYVHASLERCLVSTIDACARRGWVATEQAEVIRTQFIGNVGWTRPRDIALQPLSLLPAGESALEAFRRRPPAALPPLLGADRDLVRLAAAAEAAGFALVPMTDDAKTTARRLARTPYAKRGWGGGASTRSLRATATGEVEISSEAGAA